MPSRSRRARHPWQRKSTKSCQQNHQRVAKDDQEPYEPAPPLFPRDLVWANGARSRVSLRLCQTLGSRVQRCSSAALSFLAASRTAGETRMSWFLAFATGEDLSEGTGVAAALTPAGAPFSADDSSTAEFASGAVITLSIAFYCYLKSLPDCAVRDPVQICEGKGSRAPGRLHRWNFGNRDYLVAGKQKLFCSAHTQMYLGPGPCRTRLSHDDPSGLLRLWQKSGTGCRKQTLQAAIPFRTPCVATSAARGSSDMARRIP